MGKTCSHAFPQYIFLNVKFLAKEVLVQELHSLKKLKIYGCGKFNVLASSHCLTCLEDLTFDNCREVEGLQHLTAMKNLTVYDLRNLESLPGCLGNLSLLNHPPSHLLPRTQGSKSSWNLKTNNTQGVMFETKEVAKKRDEEEKNSDSQDISPV
ncbi:hypothetical protein JHK87_000342 [Glycine soja]|nr:hypothetical protein JHK87_000342 [Glycine soja]